jgi:hypothetical protein
MLLATTALLCLSTAAMAGPATVISREGCLAIDANGKQVFDADADVHIVNTNNANGIVNAQCKGELQPGQVAPKSTIQWDHSNTGLVCLGLDETWTEKVQPSGNFTLSCHLN